MFLLIVILDIIKKAMYTKYILLFFISKPLSSLLRFVLCPGAALDPALFISSRFTFALLFLRQFWVSIAMSIDGFYGDDHLTEPGAVSQQVSGLWAFLEWERAAPIHIHGYIRICLEIEFFSMVTLDVELLEILFCLIKPHVLFCFSHCVGLLRGIFTSCVTSLWNVRSVFWSEMLDW